MQEVYQKHNVILTAIGAYSVNTKDEDVKKLRADMSKRAMSHEHVKQIHGFHFNKKENSVRFDVVIGFDAESRQEVYREVLEDLQKAYPDISFTLAMDMDFGELVEAGK